MKDALASADRALAAVPVLLGAGDGTGSNSWVVAGEHTASGSPLLANDPHLAPMLPSLWYQMGLHCREVGPACPFDVSGYTFAGLPGVIIGHNQSIAWAFTNMDPDVTDFYLEDTEDDTVRRGDTLWDLAAAHLPAEATDAEISASWQQWYLENRAVIGPDPDLILPGQILSVPAQERAGVSR